MIGFEKKRFSATEVPAVPASIAAKSGVMLCVSLLMAGCTFAPDVHLERRVQQLLVDGQPALKISSSGANDAPLFLIDAVQVRVWVSGQIPVSTSINLAAVVPITERSPMKDGRDPPLKLAVELVPQKPGAAINIDGRMTNAAGESFQPSRVWVSDFPCFPGNTSESLPKGRGELEVEKRMCLQLAYDERPDIQESLILQVGSLRGMADERHPGAGAAKPLIVEAVIRPQEVNHIGH